MKFIRIIFMVLIFLLSANITFGLQADQATRRFGIFIGSNNGGRERVMLRYAVSDARSIQSVFREMGGIANEDSILLVEPSIRDINNRIDALHQQVLRARGTNRRTEIVFYYSGHSDEEGLLLNREKYDYRELRDRINRIPSDMRIVILDSCASGAFTRLKGGEKTQPFLMDSSFTGEGYAFLTSSSANEASQESDRIGASYFTHSLVTGLRGAADSVGDRRVTLNEVYRYAYAETLARTETSLYGTQHPSYDIQISGTGDLVLTDVSQTSASIIFDENLTGRISIRNRQDHLIVELTKTVRPLEMGLEPGFYRITLQQGEELLRAEVILIEGQRAIVRRSNFIAISAEPTRKRGGIDTTSLPQTSLYTLFFNVVHEPFPFPLIGFVNIAIGNHKYFQTGFVNWNTDNFEGFQAGFVNTVGGNFNGFQASYVNSVGANFYGFQSGFVNTVVQDMRGFQAGFINTNAGNASGFQAGFINTNAGETRGIQTGFINTSKNDMIGAQFGFINVAPQKITGTQIGFINYADSIDGIPLGFISIVKNGGYYALEYGISDFYFHNIAFKMGVEKFYTSFNIGYNHASEFSWGNFAMGFGVGSIVPIGKLFYINPELNSFQNWMQWENQWEGTVNFFSFVPYFGVNLGIFSLAAGPSVTWLNTSNTGRSGKNAEMPVPHYNLYASELNEKNQIVIGAKAVARIRF